MHKQDGWPHVQRTSSDKGGIIKQVKKKGEKEMETVPYEHRHGQGISHRYYCLWRFTVQVPRSQTQNTISHYFVTFCQRNSFFILEMLLI